MTERRSGLITKAQSGFFTVHSESGPVVCTLRGQLKEKRRDTDLAALGDRVTFVPRDDGTGIIDSIAERTRVLARRAPRGHSRQAPAYRDRPAEQVMVANLDQAVFVFSCAQPEPNLRMLDRFLVTACASEIPALICANKTDLVGRAAARAAFGLYERIGYRVQYTSALKQEGVAQLRTQLRGKCSVLAGPSGTGKSTLLNVIQPGLGLAAGAVSQSSSKGRHTTVFPQLLPLEGGGWVADTPGLRALDLFDLEPDELDAYFVEIAPLVADCAFSDCSHTHEPDCAVREALQRGEIHALRYQSFRRMRRGQLNSEG
jgi:ribosome biogenesis GTPase